MNTMVRPPQTRASGGRTLILLGVLLALAAGTIVIFVISQYTSGPVQLETVVIAKVDVHPGVVLTTGLTDATHLNINDGFTTKQVNASFAPSDAYVYTSQQDLATVLNNQVVIGQFYAGDILRANDPRLSPVGQAAPGSLTNINPGQLANGYVISSLVLSTTPAIVAGDHVDILVTECNLAGAKDPTQCETQTTLQDLSVYAVRGATIYLVLSHQDALDLKYLVETGKVDLVLRRPGDTTTATTLPVNPAYVVSHFGY